MPAAAEPVCRPWWARLLDQEEPGLPARQTLVAVVSDAFPAGSRIELPGARLPDGWLIAVRADLQGSVSRVRVAQPAAPLLWYVELPEPDARPPAATLIAYSDDRQPEGTVLSAEEARIAGVRSADQVAAVRWWTGTGLVHQIFVAQQHRRKGLAGKLLHAAFGVQRAHGWPDLHADGRRTDAGEELVRGLPEYAAWRAAARTQRLPSMDPVA